VARHLARGGARRLVLLGRRGTDTPGVPELVAELSALGAEATVARADIADREAVRAVLAGVPAAHPVTAVVHAAGVLADGVVESLTPEQLDTVLRPKVDGGWHLHELTRGLDLAAFVCFSSAAGIFGSAGQGAYAAANSFLDALMQRRRGEGLPGTSLAWGPWAPGGAGDAGGMAGTLSAIDWARMRRTGVLGLSAEQGVALWDAARRSDRGLLAPIAPALRGVPGVGAAVPPMLRDLVRLSARRSAAGRQAGAPAESPVALAQRLGAMSAAQRGQHIAALVRGHVAAVLGHASVADLPAGATFRDLGFDSLTSVQLRNPLDAAAGPPPP